jgi:hypothetical protein
VPASPTTRFDDSVYRAAVVDMLAAVGYGEISAFERMVEDAAEAPTLADKVALDAIAVAQYAKVEPIRAFLAGIGVDLYEAMAPLREPIDAFHDHIAPADWHESLVKAYVGDGLANDFYREISGFLDEGTRDLVVSTLEDSGRAAFVIEHIRAGIAADHKLAGRLALWGRRVMGEAFIQAQRVSAERDAVAELLTGGYLPGLDLTAVGDMIARIQARHVARMAEIGLAH